MKNIYQILPTIALGDGVSQQAIEMERELNRVGYHCRTYADSIVDEEIKKTVYFIKELPETTDNDVIIYHLSTGSYIVERLLEMKGKLIIAYHNITPFFWYSKYDKNMERFCALGRRDMQMLVTRTDCCFADSEFNARELKEVGYQCPIIVSPIIIDFDRFGKRKECRRDIERSKNCNILFTGRVVPNKRIEKIIETFYYVKKYYLPQAVLNIVGSYSDDSPYYKKLRKYIDILGVKDVIFKGHVSEEELISIYQDTDIYLSLSGHEGFCIPILEAMYFNIPILAYNSGAVAETMRGAGVLLDTLDSLVIAGVLCEIVKNNDLIGEIVAEQQERLNDYIKSRDNKEWLKFIL
ncbi:MAG: glycosyltransferase family 4 protein [Lachnospiraceae bacterium]|nr:glycosyltransferase family 4 protein [Lachnospiraceae bacterium]